MKKSTWSFIIISFIALANSCSFERSSVQTELYFGLSQNNGSIITDSAWNIFVVRDVSSVFSEGFTVIHSEGKWVDEAHRKMHSEPSRIVTSVSMMTESLSAKIDSLRDKYKALFKQESVLRVDKKASINF